jgi:hypothetical protein
MQTFFIINYLPIFLNDTNKFKFFSSIILYWNWKKYLIGKRVRKRLENWREKAEKCVEFMLEIWGVKSRQKSFIFSTLNLLACRNEARTSNGF